MFRFISTPFLLFFLIIFFNIRICHSSFYWTIHTLHQNGTVSIVQCLLRMQYFTSEDINVEIFVDGEDYFSNLFKSLRDAKDYMYLYFWCLFVFIWRAIFLFMTQFELYCGLDVLSRDPPYTSSNKYRTPTGQNFTR